MCSWNRGKRIGAQPDEGVTEEPPSGPSRSSLAGESSEVDRKGARSGQSRLEFDMNF